MLDSALYWADKVAPYVNKYYVGSEKIFLKKHSDIKQKIADRNATRADQKLYDQVCAKAKMKDADACFLLAEMYRNGNRVVKKNSSLAYESYRLAYQYGRKDAAAEIAHIYYVGENVEPNKKLARSWARKVHKDFNNFNYSRTYKYADEIDKIVGWPCNFHNLPGGFYIGYLQQNIHCDSAGVTFRDSPFGEIGEWSRGFQLGMHFNPSFEWGLGIHFGLFYQKLYDKDNNAAPLTYDLFRESALYLPLDASFRIPFSKTSALTLRAGLGTTLVLRGRLKYSGNSSVDAEKITYGGDGNLDRFIPSGEFGAELRFGHVSFEAAYKLGLRNIAETGSGWTDRYESLQFGITILPE